MSIVLRSVVPPGRHLMSAAVACLVSIISMPAVADFAPRELGRLVSVDDEELAEVVGQALFVSDFIQGDSGSSSTDFSFYRMGLDVLLEMNANIDKLQLGCGGFNEVIAANACDIDLDFVRFMGRSGSQQGDPATSAFALMRPYIEIAIRGDGDSATREVAGIKIGAQMADGFIGVGRDYLTTNGTPSGQTNLEHGGVCNSTQGNGALACHSGINRISGFLNTELSAQVPLTVTLLGLPIANEMACLGNTSFTNDACGPADAFTTVVTGTRINVIDQQSIPLKLSGGFLSAIGLSQGYAWITQNTRFIHGFALEATDDFFISFQRERIGYPTYYKQGYAATANAGWWMNVPSVKVVDIQGAPVTLSTTQALGSLSEPGFNLANAELRQRAPSNCFGGLAFC